MISLSKTKSGKVIARGTGKITSDPHTRETKTGKLINGFYVCSDTIGFGKNKEYESYKINAWDELANYANNLDKGDVVYVEGECKRDDYLSEKNGKDEFQITAQILQIADIGTQVANLQMMVNDLIRSAYPDASRQSNPQDAVDPSEIFKDVEPPSFFTDDDEVPDI